MATTLRDKQHKAAAAMRAAIVATLNALNEKADASTIFSMVKNDAKANKYDQAKLANLLSSMGTSGLIDAERDGIRNVYSLPSKTVAPMGLLKVADQGVSITKAKEKAPVHGGKMPDGKVILLIGDARVTIDFNRKTVEVS
jgi:hypothetical protein